MSGMQETILEHEGAQVLENSASEQMLGRG